jgi:hypothetical protein
VGIGATPIGMLSVGNGGSGGRWVNFMNNVGGTNPNPPAAMNVGLMFAWNPSNGNGESQILYGSGAGSSPRLDFGHWNGTTKTVDMSLNGSTLTVGGGTGKINVGTIDPPYTINGKPYATYLPSMTGVKEETAGTLHCVNIESGECKYVIDFRNAEEGSDIWLFSKTTNLKNNFNAMSVLLTPGFEGTVWYEKNSNDMQLIVHASPNAANSASERGASENDFEISYRLTAPRFDAASWPNETSDGPKGLIIND